MQSANVGRGAPPIHGELRKLRIDISQATVSKYMLRLNKLPSLTWRTHLSLNKDPPETRMVEPPEMGNIIAFPRLGGLHRRFCSVAA